jgi:hypothetical protein
VPWTFHVADACRTCSASLPCRLRPDLPADAEAYPCARAPSSSSSRAIPASIREKAEHPASVIQTVIKARQLAHPRQPTFARTSLVRPESNHVRSAKLIAAALLCATPAYAG